MEKQAGRKFGGWRHRCACATGPCGNRVLLLRPLYRRLTTPGRWLCVPPFRMVCPCNETRIPDKTVHNSGQPISELKNACLLPAYAVAGRRIRQNSVSHLPKNGVVTRPPAGSGHLPVRAGLWKEPRNPGSPNLNARVGSVRDVPQTSTI